MDRRYDHRIMRQWSLPRTERCSPGQRRSCNRLGTWTSIMDARNRASADGSIGPMHQFAVPADRANATIRFNSVRLCDRNDCRSFFYLRRGFESHSVWIGTSRSCPSSINNHGVASDDCSKCSASRSTEGNESKYDAITRYSPNAISLN